MDILSISAQNLLGNEAYGLGRQKKADGEGETGLEPAQQQEPQVAKAQDLHDHRRIDPKVFADLHGLNSQEAPKLLASVSEQIKESDPWSLAELQAVGDRTLIPSAYV